MPTPNALVDELESITKTFVYAIVSAMRRASLADILGVDGDSARKRGRGRSKKEPATRSELIVAYVKRHPGTTGKAARTALGIPSRQWGTYAARALRSGKVRKEGEMRAARYWAV